MKGWRICTDCLYRYKRTKEGRAARRDGTAWGKHKWPAHVYHDQPTKKCRRHYAFDLSCEAARRAREIEAMPLWADRAAIRAVYEESARLTKETGIAHEVDHVVPLRGKKVCGLHIAHNLRAIPADVNRKKSNHFMDG